ncbi:MAG: hypothetical protein V4592_01070 [Bacteroidota bacterium]
MITDTLHHAVQPVIQAHQSNPNFDLVYYVNNFYEQAWNKLIWVVSILFGIGGILLPILIQLWQRKSLRLSETEMRREIDTAIKDAKSEINKEMLSLISAASNQLSNAITLARNDLKSEIGALLNATKDEINIAIDDSKGEVINNATNIIEEKIKILEKEFERVNNQNKARFALSQANSNMITQNRNEALISYIIAIKYYYRCNEIENAKIVLQHILDKIKFENLNKAEIEAVIKYQEIEIETELKAIVKNTDLNDLTLKVLDLYNSVI